MSKHNHEILLFFPVLTLMHGIMVKLKAINLKKIINSTMSVDFGWSVHV